jgi:hypothetical protein
MRTRNRKKCFWGVKLGHRLRLTTSPPSVGRLFRKCEILDISRPYRPPRRVMGIAALWRNHGSIRGRTRDSRPDLEPTHPPKQWVSRAFSPGRECYLCPGEGGMSLKLTTPLSLVPKLRMVELYFRASRCLHGLLLN